MGKCPNTVALELCGLMSLERGGYQFAVMVKGKEDTIYELNISGKDIKYLSGKDVRDDDFLDISQKVREKLMSEVNLAFENCVPCDRAKGIPTDTGKGEKVFTEEQVLDLYDSLEAVIDPKTHHAG